MAPSSFSVGGPPEVGRCASKIRSCPPVGT
jgi:hypothetical protein